MARNTKLALRESDVYGLLFFFLMSELYSVLVSVT